MKGEEAASAVPMLNTLLADSGIQAVVAGFAKDQDWCLALFFAGSDAEPFETYSAAVMTAHVRALMEKEEDHA